MQPQDNAYGPTNAAEPPTDGSPVKNILGQGNSVQRRIIVVVGGVFILVILAAVASSIISNTGKGAIVTLADVALEQSELSNMSMAANNSAKTQLVKNLAMNTYVTTLSAETQFLAFLKSKGTGLSLSQTTEDSTIIATQLTNSKPTGAYDSTYVQIEQTQLNLYVADLQNAYKATTSSGLKTLLNGFYKQALLLQSESTAAAQNLA